jgi:EmrB/QacA subfamily drug resistance transporter
MSSAISTEASEPMAHRDVVRAISGLLLGMFVSLLASTVVSTSLPLIVSDLGGSQSSYTWIVTATLLATAVSTPLWGKFADRVDRKLLVQSALIIFVGASAAAGFSHNTDFLIAARIVQGLGAGGLAALSQIIMADIISPRERGRYAGLIGGVMAVASVGGPLLGGVVTDSLGWRWNFFVALPFAIVALIVLQLTLHLPRYPNPSKSIDYLGATFMTLGVSTLLVWVSLADHSFDWASWQTAVLVSAGLALILAFIVTEMRVEDPIVPLSLFRNRTFSLAVVGSLGIGMSLFGTAVFLSQYMQIARGQTPTVSGLLTIPMMLGLMGASALFGQYITRTGHWKRVMVSGGVLAIVGLALMGQLDAQTSMWLVGVDMFVLGVGVGMMMQNMVLVVQNTTHSANLGVATSAVTFFRTIGGTVGVSVLGSILAIDVKDRIMEGISTLSPADQAAAAQALGSGTVPQISHLPTAVASIVENAYGESIAMIFLCGVPLAIVTLLAVIFLPNISLSNLSASQQREVESLEEVALGMAGDAHPQSETRHV